MTRLNDRLRAELMEFGRRLATQEGRAAPRSGATLPHLLAALETMQLGVIVADQTGVILYANPAQATMYGAETPDEIIGRDVGIFCLPGYRAPLTRETLEKMTSWRRESVNVRKDGTLLPVRLLSDVLRGPDGEPNGVITTCEDLTEVKRAETARNRLQLQVRHSHSLENLGALTSRAAHDLKDLLMVVLKHTGLFLDDLPLDEDAVGRDIVEVDGAVDRMTELIDQLLAYSRQSLAGMQPLDLSDHLRGMLPLLEASADPIVRFRYELADDLPSIKADPTQILHVARQLITNASEAFEGRPNEIRVRTEALFMDDADLDQCQIRGDTAPGDYVVLEVADDGPGMEPEIARQIFRPFDSTKSPSRGLGLAATAAIASRHDASISLSTRPGEGTRVRLLFPMAARTSTPERPNLTLVRAEAAPPPPQGAPVRRGRFAERLPFAFGKHCPICGNRTLRTRSGPAARVLRFFLRRRSSTRECVQCFWGGVAIHRK